MPEPLVSVIIPSHDRAVLLRTRSIPSLLKQTYTHWELIVVGDGPTDDTLRRVVEDFRDERMRYVEISQPDYSSFSREQLWHAGGAAARNYGLSLARGDILAPLDDDDEFLENHLADGVEVIANDRADLTYGRTLLRNIETGRELSNYFPWDSPVVQSFFRTGLGLLGRRNVMFHSSVCYSARFKHLPYPTDGSLPGDYGLWLAIREAGGRFMSLDRPQAIYYGDSLSSSFRVFVPSRPALETVQRCVTSIFTADSAGQSDLWRRRLEWGIANHLGASDVLALASYEVALMTLCAALKLSSSSRAEVILPSYAPVSIANALRWVGFDLVFCDIDPASLCMAPESVATCLSSQTAVVIAVHPHGNPCDLPGLAQLLAGRGVRLISDGACGFGAALGGHPLGSFGDAAVFDLSDPSIVSGGQGGLVCCNSDSLAEAVRQVSLEGFVSQEVAYLPNDVRKMPELAAGLACLQLPQMYTTLESKRRAMAHYCSLLQGVADVCFPRAASPLSESACTQAAVILKDKAESERLARRLRAYRIESQPTPQPLHTLPSFAQPKPVSLPVTDSLAGAILQLPLYPGLREEVRVLVTEVIRETFGATSAPPVGQPV